MSWGAVLLAAVAQIAGDRFALWTGLIFFVAGLAHGAGDEQNGELRRIGLAHAIAYVLVGAAVAGLFFVQPLSGLAVFFVLSAWHFARSDCRLALATRYAIAGLAVGGSALLHPQATLQVLSGAIGADVPNYFIRAMAILGMAGAAFALWALIKTKSGFGHAIVAFCAVLLLHPVLAVGLIFLTAHAIPVQQRQIAHYGSQAVMGAVAIPTALAILGAAAIAVGAALEVLPTYIAVALAVGMATPHMLTERLEV